MELQLRGKESVRVVGDSIYEPFIPPKYKKVINQAKMYIENRAKFLEKKLINRLGDTMQPSSDDIKRLQIDFLEDGHCNDMRMLIKEITLTFGSPRLFIYNEKENEPKGEAIANHI
jgi:hypothetical protein